jgi:hypothetical protein
VLKKSHSSRRAVSRTIRALWRKGFPTHHKLATRDYPLFKRGIIVFHPCVRQHNIPSPRALRSGEHASHTISRMISSLSYRVRRVGGGLESSSSWNVLPRKLKRIHIHMAKLRKALSLAVDDVTMSGVLLPKQAQPVVALSLRWLSRYAFFLAMNSNLDRPNEMWAVLADDFARAAGMP